ERRQIVEIDTVTDSLRIVEVNEGDAGQSEIAFALLWTADLALDSVPGAKAKTPDDGRSDIDVVRAGEIVCLGRPQEAKAVVEHFNGAGAHDFDAIFGLDLEDREHEVLLAHRRCAFDAHLLSHCDQVCGSFLLQVFQMHVSIFFSWEVVLELLKTGRKLEAAGRRVSGKERRPANQGNWPEPLSSRGMSRPCLCQSAAVTAAPK